MVNENIYNVNWKRLLLWLIPTPLRKITLLSWLQVLVIPLVMVHDAFLGYRRNIIYWLGINSQVCFLEKMLNDKYDHVLRRIYIERPQTFDPQFIYTEPELKPLPIYMESENKPVFLYTDAETVAGSMDFVVVIPAGLSANLVEMMALIDKNKLPDKEYYIKRV